MEVTVKEGHTDKCCRLNQAVWCCHCCLQGEYLAERWPAHLWASLLALCLKWRMMEVVVYLNACCAAVRAIGCLGQLTATAVVAAATAPVMLLLLLLMFLLLLPGALQSIPQQPSIAWENMIMLYQSCV